MKQRLPVLWLACAAQVLALCIPAAAQGLRVPPTLDLAPPAAPSRAGTGPRPADYIVAVVNSEPITNNEVRQRMARFEQQLQQQGQPVPPQPQFARQVLERLISEKAQLQLAREEGMKVDDAAVDTAEQNIARQNQIDVPELRRRLRADGIALATFREELRDQILLGRLRDRELQSRAKVTDLEVDQYLRDHQSSSDPASLELNLAHILIAVPENATPAQVEQLREKAVRVQQRARAGEDFAKLAHEVSDAPDAAQNGGVVGLRSGDRYPTLFLQAVQSVPEGGVSDVVRSGAGFHILKVLEKRRGGLPGAVVMQSHVRHILLRTGPELSEQAARARLADFKRRILAGQADFAQLAKQYSQDGSAPEGGDLGWSSPGLFVPEFEDAIDALQPGQISDPIVTRFGVHLVQLLGRRQEKLTQQQQREMARNLLREKKLDDAYAEWAQEVRGRAYVEFRDPPS
jgi:peptidyl-prolyl cis-trans isomerase SurA